MTIITCHLFWKLEYKFLSLFSGFVRSGFDHRKSLSFSIFIRIRFLEALKCAHLVNFGSQLFFLEGESLSGIFILSIKLLILLLLLVVTFVASYWGSNSSSCCFFLHWHTCLPVLATYVWFSDGFLANDISKLTSKLIVGLSLIFYHQSLWLSRLLLRIGPGYPWILNILVPFSWETQNSSHALLYQCWFMPSGV